MAVTKEQAVAYIQDRYGASWLKARYDNTTAQGFYSIQLSEYNEANGHSVTYDWFAVNPATGAYTSMFGESGTIS